MELSQQDLAKPPAQHNPDVAAVVIAPMLPAAQALFAMTQEALAGQVGKMVAVASPSSTGAGAFNEGARQVLGHGLFLPNSDRLATQFSYLLFCRAGAFPGNRVIGILKRVLESDPGVGVAGPVTDGPAGAQQVASAGQHYRTAFGFALWCDYVAMLHRGSHKPCARVDSFFMLTRTDTYQRLGGFDERFDPAFYEDDDFCARAAQELELVSAVAYGAWVQWGADAPWPFATSPEVQVARSKDAYDKKWVSRSRLTLAGILPPEKGFGRR